MIDRPLPQNIEAEESLLSAFLLYPKAVNESVRLLTPSDFYRTSHQKIFNVIYELYEDGAAVDLVTVADMLKKRGELEQIGGATYLAKLVDVIPASISVKNHAEIIIEKAKLRRIIERATETVQKCFDLSESTETIEILQDQLEKIQLGLNQEITIDSIERWISQSPGEFSLRDIFFELNIKSVSQKSRCIRVLEALVKSGKIERSKNKRGSYRPKQIDLIEMNFMAASGEPCPIWLPLNIHSMVNIYPGNIIQVNGEKNSGKTALVLNIIKGNRKDFNVHYFNSEMGQDELRIRLQNFDDIPLSAWNFKAYERTDNFGDVIFNGNKDINIIDFLECHEDFWKMGKFMKDIHDKLGNAIAIVCVQKNTGSSQGLGGGRTEEKPRLILNIAHGVITIKMAKNWLGKHNPNGKSINFKLVAGCKFIQHGNWYDEQRHG